MANEKTNSLKQMGFTIEPIANVVTDENGNRWLFKVTAKAPTYYIKQTRSGKMLAFKSKNDKTDTTIKGLYDFEEQQGDLVGKRSAATPIKLVTRKKSAKVEQAA